MIKHELSKFEVVRRVPCYFIILADNLDSPSNVCALSEMPDVCNIECEINFVSKVVKEFADSRPTEHAVGTLPINEHIKLK